MQSLVFLTCFFKRYGRKTFGGLARPPLVTGGLSQPLKYNEVARICSSLKAGVSGVLTDYEHVRLLDLLYGSICFKLYKNSLKIAQNVNP